MPKKHTQRKPDSVLAAVANGDLKRLQELLGADADINESEEETPLAKAAEMGRPDLVKALLQAGADPDWGGLTVPLARAVSSGNIEWGGIDRPCPHCRTVFAAILRKRKCPHCEKEFDAHTAFGTNLGDQPLFVSWSNGFVPLMAAAKIGDAAIARMLLEAGADVNRGKTSVTPLMTACYYDHLEVAKLLIEHGADVRKETRTPDRVKSRISPVSIAANRKHISMVKLLWDAGAPAKSKDQTLLVDAARRGDLRQIDELLARGTSAVVEDPLTKEEPLVAAAGAGQAEAVARLIRAGAPVNPKAARQMPALFMAMDALAARSRRGKPSALEVDRYVATAKCLLKAGAKPDAGILGVKPIDQAREAKCRPLVELLKDATQRQEEGRKRSGA